MNRYDQARQGLTVDAADGIVRVRDGVDTWLCRSRDYGAVRVAMELQTPIDGDEGGPEAYSEFCRRVAALGELIVSGQGRERGADAQRLDLVRRAVAAWLLDRDEALAVRYLGAAVEGEQIEAVVVQGVALWRSTGVGPRGGAKVMYLRRTEGQSAPSPWGVWRWTAAEAAGVPETVGTGVGV